MTFEAAKATLQRYETKRANPGEFLRSVLGNNLQAAVRSGDSTSLENLVKIAQYIQNKLPANICGSQTAVQTHLLNE